jgi:hypothetical protein
MSACNDRGIATMMEYILLLGISLAGFLFIFAAFSAAAATAGNDATAIAAENVASAVSAAICDTVGDGSVSASVALDLPKSICGLPYLVYPAADGRSVIVCVSKAHGRQQFQAPAPFQAEGVRLAGFAVSGPGELRIAYDAGARTVTLS